MTYGAAKIASLALAMTEKRYYHYDSLLSLVIASDRRERGNLKYEKSGQSLNGTTLNE